MSARLIYRSLVIFTRNVPARAVRTAERGATAEKELRLDGFSCKTAIPSPEVPTRILWKIREPLASRFDHSRFNCPVNRSTWSSLVSREGKQTSVLVVSQMINLKERESPIDVAQRSRRDGMYLWNTLYNAAITIPWRGEGQSSFRGRNNEIAIAGCRLLLSREKSLL